MPTNLELFEDQQAVLHSGLEGVQYRTFKLQGFMERSLAAGTSQPKIIVYKLIVKCFSFWTLAEKTVENRPLLDLALH